MTFFTGNYVILVNQKVWLGCFVYYYCYAVLISAEHTLERGGEVNAAAPK